MRRERLPRRLAANEGAYLRGRCRLLGRDLVLAGSSLQLFELELHLVEKPRLALVARPEQIALELLDRQPQMRDQSLRARRLGPSLRKLGVTRAHEMLQYLDVIWKRIIGVHADDGTTTCCAWVRLRLRDDSKHRDQPAAWGRHVCCGSRQSIPSSRYPNCAGVIVTERCSPSRGAVEGQTKRPHSSRFANRHMPWPSCHSTLIREPRRPRNTNRWPLCGLRLSVSCTSSAKPSKPLRMSVWPVANHTCTPLGTGIIAVARHSPARQLSHPAIQLPWMDASLTGNCGDGGAALQRSGHQPLLLRRAPAPAALHRGDDFNRRLAHVTIPMNSHVTHTSRSPTRRPSPYGYVI